MKIFIDMQEAQAADFFKESEEDYFLLIKALLNNAGENSIKLVFNGFFKDGLYKLIAKYEGLLARKNMHIFFPPDCFASPDDKIKLLNTCDLDPDATENEKSAECIREFFLASLKPDFILIPFLSLKKNKADILSIKNFCNIFTGLCFFNSPKKTCKEKKSSIKQI